MADRIPKPQSGTRIDYKDGKLIVPDDPIVPFIEGDGTGADIWRATRYVLDGTVEKVYGGEEEFFPEGGIARVKTHSPTVGERTSEKSAGGHRFRLRGHTAEP